MSQLPQQLPPENRNENLRAVRPSDEPDETPVPEGQAPGDRPRKSWSVGLIIVGGTTLILLLAFGLYLRAASRTNHVALALAPRPVTVQKAVGDFQETNHPAAS